MERERRGLFARRGINLGTAAKVLVVIVLAFAIGIGAGWLTALAPGVYRSLTEPEPSPSPVSAASPLPSLSVEPSPLPEITRELDADDSTAGIVTATVPFRADETFTAVAGTEESAGTASSTRFLRIEIEDGLDVNAHNLSSFVMDTLNDNRGWGSGGTIEFLRTDGVPDARLVIASPRTAAALCSDPKSGLPSAPVVEGSAGATASTESEPEAPQIDSLATSCAAQGIIVMSLYDWTAGLDAYGDAHQDSRRYMLTHLVGYLLGNNDESCESGRAPVMVNQTSMPEACTVNPWAFPDAEPSPSPSPSDS